jgi:hypothetical protein
MRLFKLTPANPADDIWRFWEPEPVIVRAESESEARDLAEPTTAKMFPRLPPDVPIPTNPWSTHQKLMVPPLPHPTLCEDITDKTTEFSVDGPAAVLEHGEPL